MDNNGAKAINVIDLFCGAGGLSLGFEKAGFKVTCALDYHPDPLLTYQKNRENKQNHISLIRSDIKEIKGKNILNKISQDLKRPIGTNVIIGGPPCQGFSLRGKRKKNDPRNKLVYEFFRIIDEIRPEIFVFENVPGFLHKNNKEFLTTIINKIENMRYYYSLNTLISSDYGVPQNRERFFIIGSKSEDNILFPKKSNKNSKNLPEYLNCGIPKYDSIPYINKKITVSSALSDIAHLVVQKNPIDYPPNVTITNYQKLMRMNSKKIFNHITTKHNEITTQRFSKLKPGQGMKDLPMNERTNRRSLQRMIPSKPSRTLTSCNEDFVHYELNRIITIREMARIQSYPDDYIFYGTPTTGSDRRKTSCCQVQQIANSVPPLLAQVIAECVLNTLKIKHNNQCESLIRMLDNN